MYLSMPQSCPNSAHPLPPQQADVLRLHLGPRVAHFVGEMLEADPWDQARCAVGVRSGLQLVAVVRWCDAGGEGGAAAPHATWLRCRCRCRRWGAAFSSNDVLVMTPQILLNLLTHGLAKVGWAGGAPGGMRAVCP